MARMVDASPFADDRVDPWCWRRLASIRPGLRYLALFPTDHHSVDHHRNPSVNSRATPSVGCVARATQVSCDVVMITGVVYTTGLQDSNFTVLYLLVIIVASILFSRQGTFITSLFCISSLALTAALVHVGNLPRTSLAPPSIENVRLWFLNNSFGFLAVAYLASLLALSLRRKSSELEQKRE